MPCKFFRFFGYSIYRRMTSEIDIERLYAEFLTEFGGNIKSFCIRYSENVDDADDLMQEIFAALWTAMPGLRTAAPGRVKNRWLYRLMISVLIKHLRHRPDLITMPTELLPEPCAEEDASDSLLSDLAAWLSDDERELVAELRYGTTVAELAVKYGSSIGSVNARLSRIRRKLKEIYDKQYGKH